MWPVESRSLKPGFWELSKPLWPNRRDTSRWQPFDVWEHLTLPPTMEADLTGRVQTGIVGNGSPRNPLPLNRKRMFAIETQDLHPGHGVG